MRYKVLFFVFLLIFAFYLYISHLNQDAARLYIGGRYYYENSVSDFVVISFIVGVLFAFILGFFFDLKRLIVGWKEDKKEKKRDEFKELLEKVTLLDLRGERERAIEGFQRLSRRYPDMEESYVALADLYSSAREYDSAIETVDLALTNIGRKDHLLLKKAQLLLARKDIKPLETLLKETIGVNESNVEAHLLLRDWYVEGKDWDKAYEIQRWIVKHMKAEEEEQRFAGIRYEKIKAASEKGGAGDIAAIVKELKEIVSEEKRFIPAYILLGHLYRKTGSLNEAARIYGRGYTKTGHIVFLTEMEELYIDRRDPGVILKIYRRILDVSPKNYIILFLYARLCLRLEMIDEAIETLNTLFAEGQSFSGLHRAMAEAYIHHGELAEAVDEFKKAFPMEKAYIPFRCDTCQASYEQWVPFCESCNSWGTVNVKTEEFLPVETAELRVLYEREGFGGQMNYEEDEGVSV